MQLPQTLPWPDAPRRHGWLAPGPSYCPWHTAGPSPAPPRPDAPSAKRSFPSDKPSAQGKKSKGNAGCAVPTAGTTAPTPRRPPARGRTHGCSPLWPAQLFLQPSQYSLPPARAAQISGHSGLVRASPGRSHSPTKAPAGSGAVTCSRGSPGGQLAAALLRRPFLRSRICPPLTRCLLPTPGFMCLDDALLTAFISAEQRKPPPTRSSGRPGNAAASQGRDKEACGQAGGGHGGTPRNTVWKHRRVATQSGSRAEPGRGLPQRRIQHPTHHSLASLVQIGATQEAWQRDTAAHAQLAATSE